MDRSCKRKPPPKEDSMTWFRSCGDQIPPLPMSSTQEALALSIEARIDVKQFLDTRPLLNFQTYPSKTDPRVDFEDNSIPPNFLSGSTYQNDYTADLEKLNPRPIPRQPHYCFHRKSINDFEIRWSANQKFLDDHMFCIPEARRQMNFFRQMRNQSHVFATISKGKPPQTDEPSIEYIDVNMREHRMFPVSWTGEDDIRGYKKFPKEKPKIIPYLITDEEKMKDRFPSDDCDYVEPQIMEKDPPPKPPPESDAMALICTRKAGLEKCAVESKNKHTDCGGQQFNRELKSYNNYFPNYKEWDAESSARDCIVNVPCLPDEYPHLIEPKPMFLVDKTCPPKPGKKQPCYLAKRRTGPPIPVPDGMNLISKRRSFTCMESESDEYE